MFYQSWIHLAFGHDWSLLLQILWIKQRAMESVCSVHRSLDAWKLTDNTMHDKAKSRQIKRNVCSEKVTATDFILMLWFGTCFKRCSRLYAKMECFWCCEAIRVHQLLQWAIHAMCTDDFLHCLGPKVLEVTEKTSWTEVLSIVRKQFPC